MADDARPRGRDAPLSVSRTPPFVLDLIVADLIIPSTFRRRSRTATRSRVARPLESSGYISSPGSPPSVGMVMVPGSFQPRRIPGLERATTHPTAPTRKRQPASPRAKLVSANDGLRREMRLSQDRTL